MEPSEEMIECHTAKRTLEQLVETLDFYFPPEVHARYERAAADFETRNQLFWIERARARQNDIAEAFRKLGEWTDMTDSDLLMSAWDDELLFFYVLRTQFVFARIAAKPGDMIPGTMDGFWKWGMTPSKKELWASFPGLTASAYRVAPIKPPIWKIPYPCDYPKRT